MNHAILTQLLSGSNGLYSSQYQSVLNNAALSKISTPSSAIKSAQDTFLKSLPLSKLDTIKVMTGDGANNFTNIDWLNPSSYLTVQNIFPRYSFNGGIKNDGVSTYLDMGWAPSNGVKYTQNSGEIVVYYNAIPNSFNTNIADGARVSNAASGLAINPQYSSTNVNALANESGTNLYTNAQFDLTAGLYFVGRSGPNVAYVQKGNGTLVTSATSSLSPTIYNIFLGVLNQAGSALASTYSGRTVGLFIAGASLTPTDRTNIYNAWNTYLVAVSAAGTPATIGTVYNQTGSTWANLSAFTVNGVTAAVSAGNIVFSSGNGTFLKSLDLTNYTHTSKTWSITATLKVPTIAANSYGLGIGIRSSNGSVNQSLAAQFIFTSANAQVNIWTGPVSGMSNVASTGTIAVTAGDTVSITFTIDGRIPNGALSGTNVSVSAFNVTTSSSPVTAATTYIPNTGTFSIFDIGGANANVTLTGLTISSTDYYQPYILVQGDSKVIGTKATYYGGGWCNILSNYYSNSQKIIEVYGGGNDRSQDYLNAQSYVINVIKPKYVLINGISNDIRTGVASGTWQSNISTLITNYLNAGIKVLLSTGCYETSISQSAFQTWVNANYASTTNVTILDYVSTVIGLDADNIHPNNAGYITFGSTLLNSGKLP